MSIKFEVDAEEFKEAMERKRQAMEKIREFFKTEGGNIVKEEVEMVTPVGKRSYIGPKGEIHPGFLKSSIRLKYGARGFFVKPSAIYARKVEARHGFVARAYTSALTRLRSLVEDLVGDLVGES